MVVLIALCAIPLIVVLHDLLRRANIRRQGLRNISRHRGEALLVLAGTLLGTAIITASFVVGDSTAGSIRGLAITELGEVDEGIVISSDEAAPIVAAITAAPIEGVDGVLVIETSSAAVVSTAQVPKAAPRAVVVSIDTQAAAAFGSDPATTGFANTSPIGPGEAIINNKLASAIDVGTGDTLTAHLLDGTLHLTVVDVIDATGLAGGDEPVFVAPGSFDALAATADEPTSVRILISNVGDVFSGAERSDEVAGELTAVLGRFDVEIGHWKANLLEDAKVEGDELTTLFAGIGSFAVIAGILLLINLFNMLAEERRTDLGVMRALGAKRNVVVRQLGMEGSVYALGAAIAGAATGLGVGWIIMQFARSLLENDGLTLTFTAELSSLVLGALIGLAISLATVWITSIRISRLNIIRAIRDLPEPTTRKSRLRGAVLGIAGASAGIALFALGSSGDSGIAVIAGPPIAAMSIIGLFVGSKAHTAAVTVASCGSIAWGVLVFTLMPSQTENADIPAFVVQGLVLVSGAVLLVTTHHAVWAKVLPKRISVRLGLAHPLARRARTGLVISMYSLVIFMIMFMAVFAAVFTRQADQLAASVSAGHDLIVDSSSGNPVEQGELLSIEGVDSVVVVERAWADFTGEWSLAEWGSPLAGVTPDLFAHGTMTVVDRDARFSSDEEALRSIFADPSLIVVPEFFLIEGDGPSGERPSPGDEVVARHPNTGVSSTFTVAAVTSSDWVYTGPMASIEAVNRLAGTHGAPTRAYVRLDSGVDSQDAAARIDAAFLRNGAESTSFVEEVNKELAETEGFIRILSGYLGLGLVIGIAGLGVVMVRAVRERRREIGMLRAMGLPASVVRRAFMVEAGFVGFLGASIGTGLGLLTGYQVVTNSTVFGDIEVSYVTPWTIVVITMVGPFLASLVAAAVPAANAARIRPAAALRITS